MLWTRKRLRAECLRVIRSRDFTLKIGKLDDCRARVIYCKDAAKATVDPHQSSLIEGAIHEALHVILDPKLGELFSPHESMPSLWEAVMDTLEMVVAEDVLATPEETNRWRTAIDAKLQKGRAK